MRVEKFEVIGERSDGKDRTVILACRKCKKQFEVNRRLVLMKCPSCGSVEHSENLKMISG